MSGDRVISVNGKEASRNGSERERERETERARHEFTDTPDIPR